MVKKLRLDIFVTALIITIGIFFLGLYVGKLWDNMRMDQLQSEFSENNLDILSIFVGQEFLKSFSINDCDMIQPRLSSMSYDLYQTGTKLSDYEKKNLLNSKQYTYLKTQYFLLELRTYLGYIDFKESCRYNQTIILYFYDINNQNSERQGYILDKLVEREDNIIRVFSIDRNHEETTLNMLKDFYEIKSSPTIIINNKIKKEGFISLAELNGIIKNETM